MFYGIYTVKVLVLKRFVPSGYGKNESAKYVLVNSIFEYMCFANIIKKDGDFSEYMFF